MTDDQLLEFYVARGVISPVPPMGTGEIAVGEQDEPGTALPAEQPEQGAAPSGRRRRKSGN